MRLLLPLQYTPFPAIVITTARACKVWPCDVCIFYFLWTHPAFHCFLIGAACERFKETRRKVVVWSIQTHYIPPLNYHYIVLRLQEIGEMALDGMTGSVRQDFPARLCREVAYSTQERIRLFLSDDPAALQISPDAGKQTLLVRFGLQTYGSLIFPLFQQEPALQEQELAGTRSIAKTCAELLRHFDLASLVFNASHSPDQLAVRSLTRRQLQVLRLICTGCSEPEIARQLHIRLSTVEKHRQQAYNKLGAANALDARCIAFRARLFSLIPDTQNISGQDMP